jgi:hypothetical protein
MRSLRLAREVVELYRTDKKLWLVPLVLAMLALGGLIVFAQSSALAPFIYTLF